jgi:hypothetical protein
MAFFIARGIRKTGWGKWCVGEGKITHANFFAQITAFAGW